MSATRTITGRAALATALTLGSLATTSRLAIAVDRPTGVVGNTLRTPDGKTLTLNPPESGAMALVFYSTECPISNSYSPTLNDLVAAFPREKLTIVGVCVDPDSTNEALLEHAKDFQLKFPVAIDKSGKFARKLGVKVTPEAVVIDSKGLVRYQGRIDDQWARRQTRNAASVTHELKDAIESVIAGKDVVLARTDAIGCPLPEPIKNAELATTYAKDVAPILQTHCQACHRPGQVGPFSLMSFKDAAKRADDIATVVEGRLMPPWKPDPHVGPKFKNDRSLSDAEVATLVAWSEAGAPEGDASDLPPPAKFSDDWALGTPDLIVEPSEAFEIPASGADIYRCFVIPTNLPSDVYVSAIEYRPGNRKVVHHVLSYMDASGKGRERDKADAGPGYSCFSGPGIDVVGDLGGWAPGNEPSRLPEGIGRKLPKGADVIMQVHYHPSGKPETDRTKIGLHFSKTPIKQSFHWALALDPFLYLEPGNANKEIRENWTANADYVAYAVTPHMHLLGKDISMSLTFPDGRKEPIVSIPAWDFGWQNTYYFREPIDIPKGTKLEVVAHYDNSDKNPRNLNHPPKPVKWGEATTDEMCIGFLALTKKGQDLTRPGEVDDARELIRESMEPKEREWEVKKKEMQRRRQEAAAKAKAETGK